MVLVTEATYFYPKENAKLHKTINYEMVHDKENPIAILRRGMKFTMALRFQNGGYNENEDKVTILFNYGPNPNAMRGTKGLIKVDPNKTSRATESQSFWFSNVLSIGDDTLTIEVFSPPSIPIGLWTVQVETGNFNNEPPNIYEYENDLYFVCNPWNCHDLVYMPEERNLEEYILADVGKIWVGPVGTSRGREWIFGQFDACVLPAVWLMLEHSGLEYERRGDPIRLTRMISKMVNSNDDDGILIGRWEGPYEDGTSPAEWTGSVAILEKYLETQQPVPYGQCWVFSGVVTTMCRALGIPSRVVSNLVSAHDANSTLTVDQYYSMTNKEVSKVPADSIWNYHVWNDVYMARPDLPPGYGGWQAIDATPQETSDGVFQCGPASLEAIKKGQVGLQYDVGFMVASVNADLMRWKEDKDSEWGYTKVFCNKYHIGKYILTKQPFFYDFNGDRDREDITCQYKPQEGTSAERLSLLNAVRATDAAKRIYELPEPQMEDMSFDLKDLDKIYIGDDFSVVVEIRNESSEERHIDLVLSVTSMYYNGVKAHLISKKEDDVTIEPQSGTTIELKVNADEYLDQLVENSIMKISAIGTVVETRQTWADEDDFQVIKPNLVFDVPEEVPVNQISIIRMHFRNPLKKVLTNCRIHVSGTHLLRNQVITHDDVGPQAIVEFSIGIKPYVKGDKKLVVTFSSNELSGIIGSAEVIVVEN